MRKEGEFIRHEPEIMPCCGYTITATALPGRKPEMPRPGDLMVCFNCGAARMYTDDARTSRVLSEEELAQLEPETIHQVKMMRRIIKERGPLPRMPKSKIELN